MIPEIPRPRELADWITSSGRLNLHLRIDGHHVLHWGHGGATDVLNMVQLCHRHHWSVHEGGWQLVLTEGGRVLAIPPSHRYGSWTRAPDGVATV